MTDEDLQEYNSAGRMTDIMTANDDVFNKNALSVELKTEILEDMDVLEAAGAARVSSSGLRRDGTIDARTAKKDLDAFVRKIGSNGKMIKAKEPAFENKFVVPRGKLSSQKLLDTARAFKSDLTPDAVAKFGEYGFIAAKPGTLQTKIDNFEAGRDQQNAGKGGGVAATAETKAAVKRLKKNRRILKTVGENILEEHSDAGLIAEWKSACKIEKRKSTPTTPAAPNP